MSDELKPGDVVQLKAGGPKMTVKGPDANGDDPVRGESNRVVCTWFDQHSDGTWGALNNKAFRLTDLQRVP